MEEKKESENFLPGSLASVACRFPGSADGSWWLGKKGMGQIGKIVEDLQGPLEWEQGVLELLLMILPSVDLRTSASGFFSWE